MAAMGAFRTVWTALVGLYEETLVLVGGNLAALALNIPVFIIIVLLGLPLGLVWNGEQFNTFFFLGVATVGTLLPTPGNVALAGVTQVAAGPDIPRISLFGAALRSHWRLALRCLLVSLLVLGILAWNVDFYFNAGPGWPLFVTILWLYAGLFWLSLHVYLVPLLLHVAEPRLLDLYRRAAFISVGHGFYSLVLLVLLLAIAIVSVVFFPVYVLVAPAFISLAQACALREIRRRHGDLPVETEEEVSRL
jgi:hypothetical protein